MTPIALVLVSLACAGNAQRASASNQPMQSQALAKLLTTFNRAAAFHPSGTQPQLQAGTSTQKRFAHPTNKDYQAEKTLATPSHTDKFMRTKPTPEYDYFEPLFVGDEGVKEDPMLAADMRNSVFGQPYGKELFVDLQNASRAEQDKVAKDLTSFITTVKTDIEFSNTLDMRAQDAENKMNFVKEFCEANKYDERVTEMLMRLTKEGRWAWIEDAVDAYTEYLRYDRKEIPCSVTTGSEDLMPQIEALCKKLSPYQGFTPVIEYEVDPTIKGFKLIINEDLGYDFTEEAKQRRISDEMKKVIPLITRELVRKKFLKMGWSEEKLARAGFGANTGVDWRNI